MSDLNVEGWFPPSGGNGSVNTAEGRFNGGGWIDGTIPVGSHDGKGLWPAPIGAHPQDSVGPVAEGHRPADAILDLVEGWDGAYMNSRRD